MTETKYVKTENVNFHAKMSFNPFPGHCAHVQIKIINPCFYVETTRPISYFISSLQIAFYVIFLVFIDLKCPMSKLGLYIFVLHGKHGKSRYFSQKLQKCGVNH